MTAPATLGVMRKILPARCICSDHSCYCRDYARGWNDALDAVAAMTAPDSTTSASSDSRTPDHT